VPRGAIPSDVAVAYREYCDSGSYSSCCRTSRPSGADTTTDRTRRCGHHDDGNAIKAAPTTPPELAAVHQIGLTVNDLRSGGVDCSEVRDVVIEGVREPGQAYASR
jgi:hypothetical protein